ncbi:hypothetical protein [Desulfosporosinus sp. OT]|uniref:hypothetical protein n=1 Tax=Desulfosporosinus sp. OT TaxID=913865 RepID=UPI0002239F7B|nr:hypothetical protein [Desulfosporosinus sp. OT]EGW40674.1 hypothetical protein DOT_1297 [Desulfosporosinus sp. OT]
MKLAFELILTAVFFVGIYSIAAASRQREEMWGEMIEREARVSGKKVQDGRSS